MSRTKEPARCSAVRSAVRAVPPQWRIERCWNARRGAAEVATELRDYSARWAAVVYMAAPPSADEDLRAREASQVTYGLDVDLAALGLELTAKLCRWCAEERAERYLSLRKLVFIALLSSLMPSGRDERAEEEFELLRCAA